MRVFLLFLCFLSLISCVIERQESSIVEQEPIIQEVSEEISKVAERKKKKTNPLSEEQKEIEREQKSRLRDLQGILAFNNPEESEKNKNAICRRFEGCLRFCSDIYQKNKACHQWPVTLVLSSWSDLLTQYNVHQVIEHMEWVGRHRDVMGFLHSADYSQSIFQRLTTRLSEAQCDLGAFPLVFDQGSLYLSRSDQSAEKKKIMDSRFFNFDTSLFKGFLNQCLFISAEESHDSLSYDFLSLSEYAAMHDNEIAFSLAHQMLSKSCDNRSECIQLAYCAIDSKRVWSYIDSHRYEFGLNIEAKPNLCSYNDFHSLPLQFSRN